MHLGIWRIEAGDLAMPPVVASAPSLVGDVRGVQLFDDGTVVRLDPPLRPDVPLDPDFGNGLVASKDLVINEETGLAVRIFLPKLALDSPNKLPVLVYFHGGGFVAFHPSTDIFHNLCSQISPKLELLVISVDYRLAPEHRLPVAFEDSFESLKWIQEQGRKYEELVACGEEPAANSCGLEPWMKYADVGKCLLMGGSAGGTIVHYMGLKANEYDFSPLKIAGLIPVVPFFGGEERSESEIRSLREPDVLTLQDTDTFWLLSLPEGVDKDHDYCRCPRVEELAGVELPPCLVVVGAKDVLHSRQVEYADVLKSAGFKYVKLLEYKRRGHMLLFPEVDDELDYSYSEMRQFMSQCFS